jgi:hypothetical protein
MQKFRDQHKFHFQVGNMINRGFPELEKDKATAVTPAQAKQILAALEPWKTKSKMTADEAKGLIKSIQKPLTEKQRAVLAKLPQRGFGGGRPPGGGGGPGGAGPGGQGGSQGARQGGGGGGGGGRGFDINQMKNFNPFLTKADPSNPMSTRRVDRAKYTYAALAARAANKPLPKPPGNNNNSNVTQGRGQRS